MRKRAKIKKKILFIAILLVVVGGFAVNQALNQKPATQNQEVNQPVEAEPVQQEAVAVDPCVLFDETDINTTFQAEFEMGLAMEQKETSDKQPIIECEYRQANDGSVEGLASAYSFKVGIENYNSPENAKNQLEQLRSDTETGKTPYEVMPVENIGEEAFFYTSTIDEAKKSEETLIILKSSQIFKLSIAKQSGIDHQVEQEHLKTLADTRF